MRRGPGSAFGTRTLPARFGPGFHWAAAASGAILAVGGAALLRPIGEAGLFGVLVVGSLAGAAMIYRGKYFIDARMVVIGAVRTLVAR